MACIREFAAIALTLLVSSPAEAITILARCGPSSGQSYFFEGGVTGPGQGGWKPDGFKDGRITAFLNSENKLDIVMKDAAGLTSYLSQGYKVELITIQDTERAFLIQASGPKFSESYLFKINKFGVGTVAWTASKAADLMIRTSVMIADCGPQFAIEP